ncbi:MAG: hypothetical protein GY832_19075, partial [Chloroflexi bacterium]|nr:hypothetical protein [Chloroflexota bacterium]
MAGGASSPRGQSGRSAPQALQTDGKGMLLSGHLCFEDTDEDRLALAMNEVPGQTPESLSEQKHRLQAEVEQVQTELEQSRFMHQSDVEKLEQMLEQVEAQSEADHRAIAAEMERRTAAYQKEKRVMNDKWTVWVQERQADQANAHKEAADEFARRITKLEWQNADLQIEFQQKYGPRMAMIAGVGQRIALSVSSMNQVTNQQSGAAVPILDPSAAEFQPVNGGLPDSAIRT